jgi:hypothetical protein
MSSILIGMKRFFDDDDDHEDEAREVHPFLWKGRFES